MYSLKLRSLGELCANKTDVISTAAGAQLYNVFFIELENRSLF